MQENWMCYASVQSTQYQNSAIIQLSEKITEFSVSIYNLLFFGRITALAIAVCTYMYMFDHQCKQTYRP